jgi:1-acyl-sn-glycerol-3-phosphate acyltransferase
VIWTAKAVFATLGIRFDIAGLDNLPRRGGAVLAMSHTSYLDFALGGYPADRVDHRLVRFMAKDSIFRHPVAGPLMRGMRHIPVDRAAGAEAYETAVRALRAGELVGVFPEATMSRSLEIKELKNGAVRMAREADVPLLPMIVFGGHRILGYGRRDLTRGRVVSITIGTPIPADPAQSVDDETVVLRAAMQRLLDDTLDRYEVLCGESTDGAWWWPARRGGSAPTLEEAAAIEERKRAEKADKSS